MFRDEWHPDVSFSDWEKFRNWVSPRLIEKALDRSSANLPDWFVPLARGAAIPSKYLLRRAGYGRGWRRLPDWHKAHSGKLLFKEFGEDRLVVTVGQPWCRIEREGSLMRPHFNVNLTLAHRFGSTPILARNVQEAICLAEACYLRGLPPGLCWAEGCPDDVKGAIEYAQQRRINEALACCGFLSSVAA
jgi:hypothetical protein